VKSLNELIGELGAELIVLYKIPACTLEETVKTATEMIVSQNKEILDLKAEIFELKFKYSDNPSREGKE